MTCTQVDLTLPLEIHHHTGSSGNTSELSFPPIASPSLLRVTIYSGSSL